MMNDVISDRTHQALNYRMLRQVGPAKLRLFAASGGAACMAVGSDKPTGVAAIARAMREPGAWASAQEMAFRQIEAARRAGVRILSALDPEYPTLLSATADDPFILYVRGKLISSEYPPVAVIGTREPTRHGVAITQRLTQFLVSQGRTVISGLALGCDGAAHAACIEAGGHTVAVLAHGLHTIAPAAHRALAESIIDSGGAWVSEYGFGVDPKPPLYVRRDLTQAGLSAGVVMIQSDLTGGSLHASRAALRYGRWLAVPYPTDADRQAGAVKVQANLCLSDRDEAARCELLECKPADLARVRIVRSREEYGSLLS